MRPHRRHGLADFLVADIAVVRAVECDLKALGIAGIAHQLASGHQVEWQARLQPGVAAGDGRRQAAGGHAQAIHQLGADRLDVDRLVERPAHAHILERILASRHIAIEQFVACLVHTDENQAVFGTVDDLDAAGIAQPGNVARRGVEDEIDLARHQCRQPGRIIGDRRQHHFLDIALELAPPGRVALVNRLDAGLAQHQLIGPGAVGIHAGEALLLVREVERLADPMGLGPALAHHPQGVDMLQKNRIDAGQLELDRQLVDLARHADRVGIVGDLRARRLGPVDRKNHIVGGERGSVMELDPSAQLETPQQG